MSAFEITAVRTERTGDDRHEHITRVRLNNTAYGEGFSSETVVLNLNDPEGDSYYTEGGGETAVVVRRKCPHCDGNDYITTLPDSTTKNNLLRLPRF